LIVNCTATTAASESRVAAEVSDVLQRRSALTRPPVTLAVSDAAALGIAAAFSSPTPSGRIFERFYRTGSGDSAELFEAARTEQGFASPEGHAALYCLMCWIRSRLHRAQEALAG
jgi:hypothetical protein